MWGEKQTIICFTIINLSHSNSWIQIVDRDFQINWQVIQLYLSWDIYAVYVCNWGTINRIENPSKIMLSIYRLEIFEVFTLITHSRHSLHHSSNLSRYVYVRFEPVKTRVSNSNIKNFSFLFLTLRATKWFRKNKFS